MSFEIFIVFSAVPAYDGHFLALEAAVGEVGGLQREAGNAGSRIEVDLLGQPDQSDVVGADRQ